MFRSKLIVPALSVACLVAAQAVAPVCAMASPLRTKVPVRAFMGTKMVNLNLANNTKDTLDVKVGESAMTIPAGQTVKVSAAPGTKIVYASASATHAAGTILAQLSSEMSGATIRVN